MRWKHWYCLSHCSVSGLTTITPDEGGPQACNSCCQGPAGIPGVPGSAGIPGTNGLAGRDGLRGEMGLKGDIGDPGGSGERGPPGPRGPGGYKGDRGFQGVPGKVGQKGGSGHLGVDGQPGTDGQPGINGQLGADGQPGLPGPKGSKGDSQQVQKSSFSVFKNVHQTGSANDVLTFDHAETNIGFDFNMATNKFTCEIAGTYVFMYTIFSAFDRHDPYIKLVKDNVLITGTYNYESGDSGNNHRSASSTAILQLSAGNQVWLEFGTNGQRVYSDSRKFNTFSGFLLYPE